MLFTSLLCAAGFVGGVVIRRLLTSTVSAHVVPSKCRAHRTGKSLCISGANDDALRNGLGGAVDAAKAAACADAIRETRQKHEHELCALRSNYEAQLGALRSSCRPCANGPPASNPESGIALIPKDPDARTTACALWAIFSSERVCIRIRGPPTFDRDPLADTQLRTEARPRLGGARHWGKTPPTAGIGR